MGRAWPSIATQSFPLASALYLSPTPLLCEHDCRYATMSVMPVCLSIMSSHRNRHFTDTRTNRPPKWCALPVGGGGWPCCALS